MAFRGDSSAKTSIRVNKYTRSAMLGGKDAPQSRKFQAAVGRIHRLIYLTFTSSRQHSANEMDCRKNRWATELKISPFHDRLQLRPAFFLDQLAQNVSGQDMRFLNSGSLIELQLMLPPSSFQLRASSRERSDGFPITGVIPNEPRSLVSRLAIQGVIPSAAKRSRGTCSCSRTSNRDNYSVTLQAILTTDY